MGHPFHHSGHQSCDQRRAVPAPPSRTVVLDASAFTWGLRTICKWVQNAEVEVVIPSDVIHTLDLLKKSHTPLGHAARGATRFLERHLSSNLASSSDFVGIRVATNSEEDLSMFEQEEEEQRSKIAEAVASGEHDPLPQEQKLPTWKKSVLAVAAHLQQAVKSSTLIISYQPTNLPSSLVPTHPDNEPIDPKHLSRTDGGSVREESLLRNLNILTIEPDHIPPMEGGGRRGNGRGRGGGGGGRDRHHHHHHNHHHHDSSSDEELHHQHHSHSAPRTILKPGDIVSSGPSDSLLRSTSTAAANLSPVKILAKPKTILTRYPALPDISSVNSMLEKNHKMVDRLASRAEDRQREIRQKTENIQRRVERQTERIHERIHNQTENMSRNLERGEVERQRARVSKERALDNKIQLLTKPMGSSFRSGGGGGGGGVSQDKNKIILLKRSEA